MAALTIVCNDEQDTRFLAAALARCLPAPSCVALIGTLGAGKTRFVQAVAAACGIEPASVTSPTFVLCQRYDGVRTIFHMDAYRLHDLDEFFELGADEYFETCDISFVEWADKVRAGLPDNTVEITIDITGPTSRRMTLQDPRPGAEKWLDCIRATFPSAAPNVQDRSNSNSVR